VFPVEYHYQSLSLVAIFLTKCSNSACCIRHTLQTIDAKKQQDQLEQAKKTKAEQAAQDKKARFQKAFNNFLLLPEKQQEELKQMFFEKTDSVVKTQIKDAQRKGIDIFTSPLVSSPFKVFLVENGF
jgi:Skp family chaperone for outer membrane proteins